jgi:hypothetical protein
MEKQVLSLALLVILMGLPLLVLGGAFISPEEKTTITIEGFVETARKSGKATIIQLKLTEPLLVMSFDELNITEKKFIKAEGRLQEYKGKIQFIVEKIK